jgi:hypothetical protein
MPGFVEIPVLPGTVNLIKSPFDAFRVQEIKEYLGVIIVLFSANGIQVNDVFKQPVLCFGGDYLSKSAVGAMDKDTAESADFRGDGNGNFCFMRVIFNHKRSMTEPGMERGNEG